MTSDMFACRNHNPFLNMTYHRVCGKSNTTDATCGTGPAHPSGAPEFTPDFQWRSCYSIVSFLRNVL